MLGTLLRLMGEPALIRLRLERAGRAGVLLALAGIAGLFGFGYLLAALEGAFRLVVPAAVASLLVALCALLLALLLLLLARRRPARLRRVTVGPPPAAPPLPLSLLEAAGRTDRISGLALAFVAGVLAMRGRR